MSKNYYDRLSSGGVSSCSSIPFSSNIGVNLLQKMGWKEGRGLGKEGVGVQECIQVKKKSDNLGLGATVSRDSSQDWSDWWNDAYNDVATKLSSNLSDSRFEDLNSNTDDDEEKENHYNDKPRDNTDTRVKKTGKKSEKKKKSKKSKKNK